MAKKQSTISTESIPQEIIQDMIYVVRGQKVILDSDLASLYGVQTGRLNQQVTRNIKRFPEDFMFRLTQKERSNLMSQFVTSSWGGHRKTPLAFTEQGVAMLSSVLNSDRAIEVNIAIMRTFTKLRSMIKPYKELREKIEVMEKGYDGKFRVVFTALKQLLKNSKKPKGKIGFHS
ncbi:MAG: ORF6N domain-containing protein [Candidatus Aceula meridiana]|nr:ORF6N domain-containing protein [Candidatus Aceula meridiana]